MIIPYNCDPRFTRRALRCNLRKAAPSSGTTLPLAVAPCMAAPMSFPAIPAPPPQSRIDASSAPSPKAGSPASPSPSATPGTSTPAASTAAGALAAAPSPASKLTSNSTASWAASDAPPLLWPPPQPAPFRPNPVQELRLRWDAGRLRLELLVAPGPKGDFLVFASAPCSPGWSPHETPGLSGTPANPH